jgi:hypothetical protein
MRKAEDIQAIHTMITSVCPTMYAGVPRKRAAASENCPKRSFRRAHPKTTSGASTPIIIWCSPVTFHGDT